MDSFALHLADDLCLKVNVDGPLSLRVDGTEPWVTAPRLNSVLLSAFFSRKLDSALPLGSENFGSYSFDEAAAEITTNLAVDDARTKWAALRAGCALAASNSERDALLVHAMAAFSNRTALAFVGLAESGGGKSTLTDLADGWRSLSDETVLLDRREGATFVHGLPFRSSAAKSPERASIRVGGIFLLEKASFTQLSSVDEATSVRSLLRQSYRLAEHFPAHSDLFQRAARLVRGVPCWRFYFQKDRTAVSSTLEKWIAGLT